MTVEERLRTTLEEAADAVPERPGDLERIVGSDGPSRGRAHLAWGMAAAAVVALIASVGVAMWPSETTVEIGPADSEVVADGRLADGSWQARSWPEAGETCIEVDHPSAGTVERCVAPLDGGRVADLAPGETVDGERRAHPSLLGLVSSEVTQVTVVLADRSVLEVDPRPTDGSSEATVAAAFPMPQHPIEAQLLDAEGQLVDRLLFTRDGQQIAVPIATLTRPVGPDDITADDRDYSWPDDDEMPRGAGLGLGDDPARFAARFDDVWVHLHTDEMEGGSPAVCMSVQMPDGTATACTEVTGPLDGIVLDYSPPGRLSDPFLVGVVTDGYDHVLVDGQPVEVTNNVFHASGVSDDPDIRLPDDR